MIREQIGANEIMLTDLDNGKMTLLNSTALAFYDLCEGKTIDEVSDLYVARFDSLNVGEDRLRSDASDLCDWLIKANLISFNDNQH
jgi:hypothetical protein